MDNLLLEIEQRSQEFSVPLVPQSVGRLLSTLVTAMQANRIIEIGTGFGYSTLWMAYAQPGAGKIWTFDPDMTRTATAQNYFERAGVAERVEVVNQPALEVLPVFPQRNMDIAFIDAPQKEYPEYLKPCLHLLKLSGLIIFNNVLEDRGMAAFNEYFLNHPQIEATILPLGGGLAIGARKG